MDTSCIEVSIVYLFMRNKVRLNKLQLIFIGISTLFVLLSFISIASAEIHVVSLREEMATNEIDYTVQEENTYTNRVKELLNNLVAIGIDPNIFQNTTFTVQPSYEINRAERKLNGLTIIQRNTDKNTDSTVVILAMGSNEETLYHEIGHVVENQKLNSYGYDWTGVNELGQKYIKAKNYNHELAGKTQQDLPWEDRIAEWFAEDVKQFILEKIAKNKGISIPPYDSSFSIYRGVGPQKTEEIDLQLQEILNTKRTKIGQETHLSDTQSKDRAFTWRWVSILCC